MKRILTALGTAAALTLLAGCAGNDAYGNNAYYGNGYGTERNSSFGYRQPYPYTGYYQYNNYDRQDGSSYYSRDPRYTYDGRNYYRR